MAIVPDEMIEFLNRKERIMENINLNTLANCVTAVCAVVIAIKVF